MIRNTNTQSLTEHHNFSEKRIFLFQSRDIANTNFTPVPYGLACIGAVLQEAGAEVAAMDQNAPYVNRSFDYLLENIRKHDPHFIGLRLSITAAFNAYKDIKNIKKEFKNIPIIVGGPHATINPEEVLKMGADFVVRKEGEVTILNLINALIHKEDPANIKGIAYKTPSGAIAATVDEKSLDNLDILPLPAKKLFRNEDYIRTKDDLRNFACIFTSRDCPGKCTYCAARALGDRYRYRSAASVLGEIRYLYDNYGIANFNFLDDAFTVKKDRVAELCQKIKNELGFKIIFSCNSTINDADRTVLETLKDAGCANIVYGVERIDKESQKRIRKGYKMERIERVINDTADLEIDSCVNFMFGFPWDTKELIDQNFRFAKKYYTKVHFNMTGVVVPYPGTELYNQVKERYAIADWWLKEPLRLADESRPFFRRKVLCDDSIIDRNFFGYSDKIKNEIRKVYWWITWNNARCSFKGSGLAGWVKAVSRFSLYRLSQFLFYLNPRLERNFFTLIGKMIKKVAE